MASIQRLNMDNSWMLTIGGKRILIDPWLVGEEIDFFSWFNTQWHKTKPIELDKIGNFDCVLITQKYPDHFHLETLKLLKPAHLLVPESIAIRVSKEFPMAIVNGMGGKLKSFTLDNLRFDWLNTSRKIDPIYDAVVVSTKSESVFIASHGFTISTTQLSQISSFPPFKLLICPFNLYKLPFFLGSVVSPGITSLENLVCQLNPSHFVATHDEDKHAKGLVTKLAKVIRCNKKDLESKPMLYDKCLEINHYNPIEL